MPTNLLNPGLTSTLGPKENYQKKRSCLQKVQTTTSMTSLHKRDKYIQLPAYLPQETSHTKPNK